MDSVTLRDNAGTMRLTFSTNGELVTVKSDGLLFHWLGCWCRKATSTVSEARDLRALLVSTGYTLV